MDGIGTRGKWKKKSLIDTLAFLCMLILASGVSSSQLIEDTPEKILEKKCKEEGGYLTDKLICCNRCHPGFKLKEECQDVGHTSKCVPCDNGTYNAYSNYQPNCRSCTKCKERDNKEEESECIKSKNAVCRCKGGFYKKAIDSEAFDCLKCTECGIGETPKNNCTQERDTVCRCSDGYYKDKKSKCQQCEICTAECKHLCPRASACVEDPNSPGCEHDRNDSNNFSTALIIGVSATTVLLVVVGFITYKVTKDTTTRKLKSTSSVTSASTVPTEDSVDCTSILIESFEEHPDKVCDKAFPPSSVSTQEPSNLPDCIPKISELIYTVLHWVPVPRVKELARKLDVPDIEIERAEADHRLIKEAHYQMLKVWADRGLRAGGSALVGRGDVNQQPWLQELLGKLDDMNLGQAIQELEKKYSCQ